LKLRTSKIIKLLYDFFKKWLSVITRRSKWLAKLFKFLMKIFRFQKCFLLGKKVANQLVYNSFMPATDIPLIAENVIGNLFQVTIAHSQ